MAVKVKKQPGAVAVVKADYVCALENRHVLTLTETVSAVRALLAHDPPGQPHINQFYVAYFEYLDVLDGIKSEVQARFCAPNVDCTGRCRAHDRPRFSPTTHPST